MKKIRILVVDDQSIVREGLVSILSIQDDIEVVGEAADGIVAVELARKTKPNVILLDMVMPRQDGLTAIPLLKEFVPDVRILVLTSFAESSRAYQAIKSGALGYMLKDATRNKLLQSIRDVAKGQASLQPSIAMKVIYEIDHPLDNTFSDNPLTPHELETLKLIAQGLSNQEIATIMVIHERTVQKYVSSILDKLHLANRTQAALYAIRQGLARP